MITRCTNNYGPRQFPEKLIPKAIIRANTSLKVPIYGTGENVRDWIFVLDHCRAVEMVLEAGEAGEVSEKYERGRHTTTRSVMVTLGDGCSRIVDTPGFRRLAIRGIPRDSLVACFPEMRPLAEACAYGLACGHQDEPGCRVRAGVEEGLVHPDRYESYLRVRAELDQTVEYAKKPGKPRRDYADDDE